MVLNIPTSDGLHDYVNYDYLNRNNQQDIVWIFPQSDGLL